jgi:hypothetical protein
MNKDEIIVEKWESFTEFRGQLLKVNLKKLAKEYERPDILEMNEEDLNEFICYELEEYTDTDYFETYLAVVNQSDPDLETNIFTNNKEALDGISWRGFYRGDPSDWQEMDWNEKKERIEALEKELKELKGDE